MANYDLESLQGRMLQILVELDKCCREHGLRYYMTYGTMLGAWRHKGFIPWDDDVDITMPRADYERFIQHWREWLPGWCEFICPENDTAYPLPYGKVQDARTTLVEKAHRHYTGGIYCDLTPLDGIPPQPRIQRSRIRRYRRLFHLLFLLTRDPFRHGRGPRSWLPWVLQRCYTVGGTQRKIRRLLLEYDYDHCDAACLYNDHTRAIIPRSVFGTPTDYEFCGHRFWGPERAEEYLTACFGSDYMTPPPPDKRHQHNFFFMDLQTPYREYGRSASRC